MSFLDNVEIPNELLNVLNDDLTCETNKRRKLDCAENVAADNIIESYDGNMELDNMLASSDEEGKSFERIKCPANIEKLASKPDLTYDFDKLPSDIFDFKKTNLFDNVDENKNISNESGYFSNLLKFIDFRLIDNFH